MRSTTAYQVPRYIYLRVPYTRYVYCICTTGSDPIPGDDFVRHYIIGMFSEGIFRLLGFIVLFELLNQVISHCPKMYRLLWYEYDYQHCIKTRTRCYSFDQYVRKCNDSLVVNMIIKNCIILPEIVSTVLLLLCEHPAHRNSKSRVYPLRCQDSGPPTRSYTAAAAAAAAAGVADQCCC